VAGDTNGTSDVFVRDRLGTGDAAVPSCALTGSGTDGSGRKYIQVTVQDTGSGLARAVATTLTNGTLSSSVGAFGGTPPTATFAGVTGPVVVTVTKVNQSQSTQVAFDVFDVAGNKTSCDPVLVTLSETPGQPQVLRFTGLPQAEGTIAIANGTPGLRDVQITVNGREFEVEHLRPGKRRTLSVAAAMQPGNANTIALSADGPAKGEADVPISDAPAPSNPIQSTPASHRSAASSR
jgi:hypothetical protein